MCSNNRTYMTDQDRRIKDERIEIITKIFAECCRYPNVYIEAITYGWGVLFQVKYLDKYLTQTLTNKELYIGKGRAKFSDYYAIGDSIRAKLDIPADLTLGTL